MLKKGEIPSFERAIFEGQIQGPQGKVVDIETGQSVEPGNQNYGHTALGRRVISSEGDKLQVTVIDYQQTNEVEELGVETK